MISCIDITELSRFLEGKLEPERMTAVDQHLRECAECRDSALGLTGFRKSASELGASLLEVADCPEYEELSAYVEGTLGEERARSLSTHLASCEPCFADVERIRELRSRAALRGNVTVQPGMSRRRSSGLGWWKRALAGAVCAGAVIAAAVWMTTPRTEPGKATVALKPPRVAGERVAPAPKPEPDKNRIPEVVIPDSNKVAMGPEAPGTPDTPTAATAPKPEPKPILRDGQYGLFDRGRRVVLAKVDGVGIRTQLEARLMQAIEEKVRTGKIKLDAPVQMAMNTMTRDHEGYTPPPTAPKPLSPQGKMLLTNRPTLTWSKVDLAESYHLVVTTTDGAVMFEQETRETSMPVDRPLPRGRAYLWQVWVRFSEGDDWAKSKAVPFGVVSDEAFTLIEQAKADAPGSHLALGAACEAAGLYDEAAAHYTALVKSNPRSALARKMLAGVTGRGR